MGVNILPMIYLTKDLYSGYIKNTYYSTTREIAQLKNGQRTEVNPLTYSQLMTKEAKICNGEKTPFNKWYWKS